MVKRFVGVVAVVAVWGCVNSQNSDYLYACGAGGTCPAGDVCAGDNLCHPIYVPDGGAPDAGPYACGDGGACPAGSSCNAMGVCSGPTGGTTGAGTTGGTSSSTSGSTSGTTGSTSGSTTGSTSGTTSGGPAGCVPPDDAGWPTTCGAETTILDINALPSTSAVWGLSVVAQPNGSYLIAILESQTGVVQFVSVAANGTVTDAGFLGCSNGSSDCPSYGMALIAPTPAEPPVLVAGYFPPGTTGNVTDEVGCWSPYNSTAVTPLSVASVGSNQVDVLVDEVSAATMNGQIAVAVTDFEDGEDVLAVGPTSGGCPSASAATLLHGSAVFGLSVAPSGVAGSPFLVTEQLSDQLSVSLFGQSGTYLASVGTGIPDYPPLPIAVSDGTAFTAITSANSPGAKLFTGTVPGLAPLFDGGVLAPSPAFGLSGTSCGTGCGLLGFVTGDAGVGETPTYEFTSHAGCTQQETMAPFNDDVGLTALTAVAAQTGSAILLYASSQLVTSDLLSARVNMRLCTAP